MMELPAKRVKLKVSSTSVSGSEHPTKMEEPTDVEIHEKDLPLLANVDKVKVVHYLIQLRFDFDTKQVQGVLVLFIKPTIRISFETIVLDSCSIKVQEVYALKLIKDFESSELMEMNKIGRKDFYKSQSIDWFTTKGLELKFQLEKWSLSISGWSSTELETCPSVIRIHYDVLPTTASLNWRPTNGWNYNQGPKCVFTPASPINNRGLFPCQEPPSAMATWECFIKTEKTYLPLVTSDELGEVIVEDQENKVHYFFSSMILPMSTFAIVIGQFPIQVPVQEIIVSEQKESPSYEEEPVIVVAQCNHDLYPCRINDASCKTTDCIKLRLWNLSSEDVTSNLNVEDISKFLKLAIKATYRVLGTFPFERLDLIILPKSFADLGLCSPQMIFLSPSLFHGDDPLYYFRLPHEISHFWFGLLIGALDWQEEFLSEGFATFMEDVLYKEIWRGVKDELEVMEEIDTKACLRLITLQNELKNTDSDLQVLSLQIDSKIASTSSHCVKHGLVPMKQFMQVHYLKGYFLLKYLSHLVGEFNFLSFLKAYVQKFHGQLVTSEMFFQFYFSTFSKVLEHKEQGIRHIFIDKIQSDWLHSNTIPEPFKSCDLLNDANILNPEFIEMFPNCQKPLTNITSVFDKLRSNLEPEIIVAQSLVESLQPSQLVLLLEKIINLCSKDTPNTVSKTVYESMITSSAFKPTIQNPESLHRFCELIILNKDERRKSIVETFLQNHISLGVYLYGELMISEKVAFQKIARRLFKRQIEVFDSGQKTVLRDMIF